MSFEWKDFYSIAEHLRDNASNISATEAAQRSAISRAYYAAFCHARDVAIAKHGYKSMGSDDHRLLRDVYRTRMPKIATYLEDLKQWRKSCDYESKLEPSRLSLMISGIGKAKYVLNTLHLA